MSFAFFVQETFAQKKPNSTERNLPLVLKELEARFPFKFSYADDVIQKIKIKPVPKGISFKESITYLKEQTQLDFQILESNFVTISVPDRSITICGYIKDRFTQEPISGANIIGKSGGTSSTAEGYFEVNIKDPKETVLIGHLVYETSYRLADSFIMRECLDIFLDPKTEELEEVIIKNYLTKGIDKTDVGYFTLDYENFGILPGLIETDVLQTAQSLPGIQSVDETVSNINIRGGTHDQNLILWDGIKMYQSGHFFGLISVFNPYTIKQAQIVKNGSRAEFTDGVSGSILMSSGEEINTKINAGASINLINTDFYLDIPVNQSSSLLLSGRKAINNWIETPTYEQYFDRVTEGTEFGSNNENDIEFDFYDINIRYNYQLTNKDYLRLNFLSIYNELEFAENALLNERPVSRRSSLTQNSIAGGLFYERKWSSRFKTSFQFYETDYRLKSINVNIEQEQTFFQENKVSESSAKAKAHYQLTSAMNLTSGYQFTEVGVTNLNEIDRPVFRDNQVRVNRIHGLFSQLGVQNKNWGTLTCGLRYSFHERLKEHLLEPRLNYHKKFLRHFNLELLMELKHQNTSQVINFQNDFLGIEKRRWVLSEDETLPLIKGRQVSLGLHYDHQGWLVSTEAYYKKVLGINSRSQGFLNAFETENVVGDYDIRGVEILVNKRFHDVSTWVSYTLTDSEYFFPELSPPVFPSNLEILHTVTFGLSYTLDAFKIAAGMNYHSGLPTTNPDPDQPIIDGEINYLSPNNDRLKEYLRFDISATYQFKLWGKVNADTGVSLWNITDRNNVIDSFYRVNRDNEIQKFGRSSLGLTPNASFKVYF